jgi:two-component system sensor histidine kinase HydH
MSLYGYRVVRGALDVVVQGQGEALLQSILRATRHGARVDDAVLRAVLDSESPRGLRCLAMFEYEPPTPGQPARVRTVGSAGPCLTASSEWQTLVQTARHNPPTAIGDRIRLILGPPPPPPQAPNQRPASWVAPQAGIADEPGPVWPRPPTVEEDAQPPGPPGSGPRGGRPVLFEFVPKMADALRTSALGTLLAGGIATLVLLLAAVVFWRLSLREERAYATAEQKRQLASLGEMAAVLAHELRNPLAALKGHAQLLHEQLPEGSRPRDKAARVVSEAERLEALSEDLLSFVRTTVIEPQDVSPAALLADCAALAADARVQVDSQQAPPRWRLDPQRMQQLLGNLLRNALEASPPDGKVVASVRSEGSELVLRVRDHGPGIREEDLERIFEPFYTTRARGTGLGLAIVRRLVSLHGGRIAAKNADEGGAVFTVRLPKELP